MPLGWESQSTQSPGVTLRTRGLHTHIRVTRMQKGRGETSLPGRTRAAHVGFILAGSCLPACPRTAALGVFLSVDNSKHTPSQSRKVGNGFLECGSFFYLSKRLGMQLSRRSPAWQV